MNKPGFNTINKCDSESNGIFDFVQNTLIEAFKRILTENKGISNEQTECDKMLISCLLWEFIFPTLKYPAVLEKIIIPFFQQLNELHELNYFDYAVNSLLNYCSPEELKFFVTTVFHIFAENSMTYFYMDEERYKELAKMYQVFLKLLKYPRILGTWLQSENLYTDLECLFFTHLPSRTDLERTFTYIYYPNTIFQPSSKSIFYNTMAKYCQKCNSTEEYLFELVKILMAEISIPCATGSQIVPRIIMINFLDHLIKKNVKYIQEFGGNRNELTFPSSISNLVFALLNYLDPYILQSTPKSFPFTSLYRADEAPEFVKLDRMGGILSYLLTAYEEQRNSKFKELNENSTIGIINPFIFSVFNKAIILLNYIVIVELNNGIKGFEQYIQLSRESDELSEEKKIKTKTIREEEIRTGLLQGIPYQHYIYTYSNIKVFF